AGPVAWLLSSSFKTESEITAKPPTWMPKLPTGGNYAAIFDSGSKEVTYENRRQGDAATSGRFLPSGAQNLLPWMWNSFVVGTWVAVLSIVLSLTAAFAIAVINFRGRRGTLYTILVTRMIPDTALIVPLFLAMRNFGLVNTRLALVATHLAVTLPFTIFIL